MKALNLVQSQKMLEAPFPANVHKQPPLSGFALILVDPFIHDTNDTKHICL
jgi:hypothetical protein